ncbi:FG-GAP-like repeat-containing protein [Streptomyces sp. NPDC127072]|uniref:FG-GAP-like repeat-containing protein n=1 Tax=Streptomyces sp. NPDC127072 TaxID=3347129 RepID=UPI003652F4D8
MRTRTFLVAAALLSSGLTPLALAAPATAAASKYADDFNGDGYRDLAVGDETATTGGKKQAGAVAVVWGTARGLDPAKHTVITENSPNVAGGAETNDFFGSKITPVDLNKDGYGDLLVAAPGEDVGGKGAFTVLWGAKSGLTSGSQYRSPGFAKDLAVGDFNADGKLDVVAVDDEYVWFIRGPFTKSGTRGTATNLDPIHGEDINPDMVVSGKVTKDGTADFAVVGYDTDTRTNRLWFYRGSTSGPVKPPRKIGLPGSPDLAGSSATIADFNKDGYGDVAIGVSRSGAGGAVKILPGTSAGPATSVRTITQNTASVPGTSENGDMFGYDVSAWDSNGDDYPDLAVGAPREALGDNFWSTGAVTVLRGSASGLTGKNSRQYDYATTGVEGPMDEGDTWFGASVLLRDYNRDGRAELIATSPEIGRLHLLPGTRSGPTGTGSTTLKVADLGLGARPYFGAALAD